MISRAGFELSLVCDQAVAQPVLRLPARAADLRRTRCLCDCLPSARLQKPARGRLVRNWDRCRRKWKQETLSPAQRVVGPHALVALARLRRLHRESATSTPRRRRRSRACCATRLSLRDMTTTWVVQVPGAHRDGAARRRRTPRSSDSDSAGSLASDFRTMVSRSPRSVRDRRVEFVPRARAASSADSAAWLVWLVRNDRVFQLRGRTHVQSIWAASSQHLIQHDS